MHIIQREILDKLTYAKELRYAAMRPKRIESNLFSYHLKELVKDGYVSRLENGAYTMNTKGKAYVDRISHRSLSVRVQPKIVTLLYLENSNGEQLLVRRKHQPYIDMVGLPSGKLHLSERIADAAQRELVEKTEMSDIALRHAGMAYVEMRENGEFISQILAHVQVGKTDDIKKYGTGGGRVQPLWLKAKDVPVSELIPGTLEIIDLIHTGEFFFAEFCFDLADYS